MAGRSSPLRSPGGGDSPIPVKRTPGGGDLRIPVKRAPRFTKRRTTPTRATNAPAPDTITPASVTSVSTSETGASASEITVPAPGTNAPVPAAKRSAAPAAKRRTAPAAKGHAAPAPGSSALASEASASASEITAPASDSTIRLWFPLVPAANRGTVRLPGHLATEEGPGIAEEDLHPTLPVDRTRLIGNGGRDHAEAIRDHYARVKFAPLDGNGALTVAASGMGRPLRSFIDLAACSNCLLSCGTKQFLDSEEVYFSMRRLMARTQTQNGAFLGSFAQGRWWIAPAGYVLRLERSTVTNYIGDGGLSGFEEVLGIQAGDRANFLAATVTIHLVQSGTGRVSHFSLLVHHVPTGNTWYMDSSDTGTNSRFNKAKNKFQQWLRDSRLPAGSTKNPPPVHRHCPVPLQDDGWSCGLHCIMNALIFVRFGAFGWDKVGAWDDPNSAMDALKKSLHHTLGIQYSSKKTRVQPPRKATRAPKPIQPTKPIKPTKLVQPPTPTNHPIPAKMRPKPPIKPIPKVDPKYEAIRRATLPGGTNPNAPTPDMLRDLSSSPDLPSTAPASRAPPAPAPTGGPAIPVRHKTRSPLKRPRPEEPAFVPSFDDDVMDLDPGDADDDQSPLQRRTAKRQRSDVTPTPTRTAKRRRTEAAVTPSGRRTEAAVTPSGPSEDDRDDDNDKSSRSTLSTPPSAKRYRTRVLAHNQAQRGRRESFSGLVTEFEGGGEGVEGSASVARVIGGLWDGRGGRREGVESRYAAAPRGVWRGGGGRRLARGERRRRV